MPRTREIHSRSDSPVSRRALLRATGGAAAAASALALVGCDGDGELSRKSPEPGGTLRFGTTLPMAYGLDPHLEQAGGLPIFPKVYGYLFHVDQFGDVVTMDHAETLEQPDDVTYVITLRGGVKFQNAQPANGRDVTAHDAARSMERFRTHPLVVDRVWHTTVLEGFGAPSDRTLVVRTKRPYAWSIGELGSIAAGAILPVEAIDIDADLRTVGSGSGPFAIERADPATGARLVRYDGYHRTLATLDAMEWRVFESDEALLAAMLSKEIDAASHRREPDAATGTDDLVIVRQGSLSTLSLGLRVDRPPFNDPRVREAIDLAIAREPLGAALTGERVSVAGAVNPNLARGYWALGQDELSNAYQTRTTLDERRQRARALIEAAGASSAAFGLQVSDVAAHVDAATALAIEHLAAIGLAPRVEPLNQLRWFANFRRGAFEATLMPQTPYESPDTPVRLYHSSGLDGVSNPFGFSDPQLDTLIERSWGEADREMRRRTLLEAQRAMLAARPMIHLFASAGYTSAQPYVREHRPELEGSAAARHYEQWLDLPIEGRPA